MPAIDLKARSQDIQRRKLMAELQRLLAQLENPELTIDQLDRIKQEVGECQKRYAALGYPAASA
jgi:hypothetical protein